VTDIGNWPDLIEKRRGYIMHLDELARTLQRYAVLSPAIRTRLLADKGDDLA
jgi:hypothetical protein